MTMSERRTLRRRLGPVAWCVLEDLTEEARVDSQGRRVATSSVRRLAENLGVSKDTTARALRRLTSAQLIAALPATRSDSGRFGGGAYLICAAVPHEETAPLDERGVVPAVPRRPRARATATSQPSLFDATVDHGNAGRERAPGLAEREERRGAGAGRGDAEAGARTGRSEDGGREGAGGEAAAAEARAAG